MYHTYKMCHVWVDVWREEVDKEEQEGRNGGWVYGARRLIRRSRREGMVGDGMVGGG